MHGAIFASGPAAAEHYRTRYIWLISAVAALGGFLFGYDWVVIGGAKPFYEKYFELQSEQLVGWANSCALVGCLLGSLVSGAMSDRCGRKKLLILSAVIFAVSSVSLVGQPHLHGSSSGASRAESPSASPPRYRPCTWRKSAPRRGGGGWSP